MGKRGRETRRDATRTRPTIAPANSGGSPPRSTPPAPTTTPVDPLQRLERNAAVMATLVDARRLDVDAARAAGISWRAIGAALGVSAQAAQQRYGAARTP